MMLVNNISLLLKKFLTRKYFYKLNYFLFDISIHGMGILNWTNMNESGEDLMLKKINEYYENKPIVIFDIGANIGQYYSEVKKRMPLANIYAFEPHPISFNNLKKSLKNTKNLNNFGFSNRKGKTLIYDALGENGGQGASLYKGVIEEIQKQKANIFEINLMKIDDFVLKNKIKKINLLKIDTEGAELSVLEGATNTIRKNKIDFIHFEFNEMNVISRVFFRDFIKILPNYRLYRLLPDGLINLNNYYPLTNELFAYQNILAVKNNIKFDY